MRLMFSAATVVAACALAACGSSDVPGGTVSTVRAPSGVTVLSNRADLVSGDDVLIEVELPAGVSADSVVLKRNGSVASGNYGLTTDGRYLARVTGLALGANEITVDAPGIDEARATVINHPNGGPVFSGPQIQPWVCQETALDAQCNQPAEYTFLYKSTDASVTGLQPYDPENPPADVAQTTPDGGEPMPFIVRQERGYQDRDEYKILMLFVPGQDWQPWSPQAQWNRKLLITHGGGCGTAHGAGSAPLEDYSGTIPPNPAVEQSYVTALGRGFAVASTALDNLGHNCNVVTGAESLMMVKERLVEQYGELRYTMGTGCSGGSITQQHVANAYPGIYQGLITTCAYPDVLSTGAQFFDYHLLRYYFEPDQETGATRWGPGVVWSPTQMADVEGHVSHVNAVTTNELFFKEVTNPSSACSGVSDAERYDAATNPGGVRCGILDYFINTFGPRPPEVWGPEEQIVGRGFGGNFLDNNGIQYGLTALRTARITPAQFVDLNEKIGGVDIDIRYTDARVTADPAALVNGYRSGGINSTNNLKFVAIINAVGPDPGAAHDTVHAWWTRWRLDREQGHHDNHAMWAGPTPLVGDVNYMNQALAAMDRWLAAIEADASATPLPQKIIGDKPADIHDQCSNGSGVKVTDEVCPEALQGRYSSPRVVAGAPIPDDIMKCQLKPLSREDDYGLVPFLDGEWSRLEALFPEGVCDYSLPGVGQQGTIPWQTYQDTAGNVIYGGTALPASTPRVAPGWASPAFSPGE